MIAIKVLLFSYFEKGLITIPRGELSPEYRVSGTRLLSLVNTLRILPLLNRKREREKRREGVIKNNLKIQRFESSRRYTYSVQRV